MPRSNVPPDATCGADKHAVTRELRARPASISLLAPTKLQRPAPSAAHGLAKSGVLPSARAATAAQREPKDGRVTEKVQSSALRPAGPLPLSRPALKRRSQVTACSCLASTLNMP